MNRGWIIWVGMLFLINACELRPLPELEPGEVRFFLQGKLDGTSINKEAGKKGEFLFTGHEMDGELGIYWGKFAQANCENCSERIEIRFRDLDTDIFPDAIHMDSLLKPGQRKYFVASGVEGRKRKKVIFTNQSKGNANISYKWDFGDGTTSTVENPVHVYQDPEIASARVCLESQEAGGCTTLICNEIQLGDSSCQVDFSHRLLPNSTYVAFSSTAGGTAPFTYSWDFGDGGTASLGNPGYFYAVPTQYEVCLTVTDAKGCVSTLCKNIAADPAICEHNFAYSVGGSPVKDFLQPGRIEVIYTDANGRRYSSAFDEQPASSSFEIQEREPFEANLRGEQTYSFRFGFDCLLWDEDGNVLEFTEGISAAAVAY